MDWWWEILIIILGTGIVGFLVFLLGYAGYSIIKRGKRKRIMKEEIDRKLETERLERYMRDIDNDLKREIDNIVKEQNRKNGTESYNKNNYSEADFSNDLTEKIKRIIQTKILNKLENKYRILNERYEFDENYKTLDNIKRSMKTGIDKFIDNLDRKK